MPKNLSTNLCRRLRRLTIYYKGEISLHFDLPSLYRCHTRSPLLWALIRILYLDTARFIKLLLVSSPDPTPKRRIWVWGHWCRFLVLQAQQSCDYLHRFVLEHVQSRDGAHDQEKASNVPRPFPRVRDGVWERD